MTLASWVTLLRLVLILPIIYFITIGYEAFALILFLIAGITDYLDGFIARKTGKETSLGAFLDLLADKLLVCLVLLWCASLSNSRLIIGATFLIIARELIISCMRQFLVQKIGKNPIKVTYIAKSKTTIQIISISFLILSPNMGVLFNQITIFLVCMSSIISLYTLFNYFINYRDYF
jgi:CDP-diacylglycerol--glycerol-3-phosphate 3-phosphatidyltransferase